MNFIKNEMVTWTDKKGIPQMGYYHKSYKAINGSVYHQIKYNDSIIIENGVRRMTDWKSWDEIKEEISFDQQSGWQFWNDQNWESFKTETNKLLDIAFNVYSTNQVRFSSIKTTGGCWMFDFENMTSTDILSSDRQERKIRYIRYIVHKLTYAGSILSLDQS